MQKIIYLTILTILLASTANAQTCSSVRPYSPELCLFSGSLTGISGSTNSNLCGQANQNPFNLPPISGDATTCKNKVYEDGNACVEFYFELFCSMNCIACNQFICKSFCQNAQSICPKTAAAGCFGTLNYCADSNTGCTSWNVDKTKFPPAPTTTQASSTTTTTKASATTTGAVSTTTTTKTGTNSQTSSSGNMVVFTVFTFMVSLIYFLF